MSPIDWIKSNKLASLLILIVLFFLLKGTISRPYITYERGISDSSVRTIAPQLGGEMMGVGALPSIGRDMAINSYEESTAVYSPERRVVTESYLSLQVLDVTKSLSEIKAKTQSLNGFMVNSSVSRPEEAASGNITVRVPTDRAEEMVEYLKENSVKVVQENIQGRDITDQYKDIESRLTTLEINKSRFETIMEQATTIEEILKVQTQLFSIQDQIDSLVGQRDYLRDTSDTVKITAYLSTDEYALPYVPDTSWRPEAIFKEAVRSLIMDIRGIGNTAIWLLVYAVIWIPVVLVFIAARRYWKMRTIKVPSKRKS